MQLPYGIPFNPRTIILMAASSSLFSFALQLQAQLPDAPSFTLQQPAAAGPQQTDARQQRPSTEVAEESRPKKSWIIHQSERPRLPGALPVEALTFKEQTNFYIQQTFSPYSFLICTYTPATNMTFPEEHYPKSWQDGVGAYARNYGDIFATEVATQTGKYLTAALVHEDPRYFASSSRNVAIRALHAISFTVIDHDNHGQPRIALSNFAGVLAGGFVGRAYRPAGFNDNVHSLQRSLALIDGWLTVPILGTPTHNIVQEFSPEIRVLAKKMHLVRSTQSGSTE